jgi:hypothetical protein
MLQKLLTTTERPDADTQNLRRSAYEAVNQVIESSGNDMQSIVSHVLMEAISRLEKTFQGTLTHSHTHLLTHLLTHSLTYLLTHSLTYSLTHSLMSPGGSFTAPNSNLQVEETPNVFNGAMKMEESAQLTAKMADLVLKNEVKLKKIELFGGAMSILLPESFEDIR